MGIYKNKLAETMFKISCFGGQLTDWANKQSKLKDIDYEAIQEVLTISKEVARELEQLLKDNQQNIIQIDYDTDAINIKIDRMIQLLTEKKRT